MIKLFQLPAAGWNVLNPSPFCMKVELYLRMVGLPYEVIETVDLKKAPKNKVPYVENHGVLLGDSHFIIERLKKDYGNPLDATLRPPDHSQAVLIRTMLEEGLYFCLVYSRWIDDAAWPTTRNLFFGSLPAPLRAVVPGIARRKIRQQLHAQGVARHKPDEVYELGRADISALSEFLGNKPYFLGDAPRTLDATTFGFLANILHVPIDTPLRRHAESLPNLVAYANRMRERFASPTWRPSKATDATAA